jgi:hypothetical protein
LLACAFRAVTALGVEAARRVEAGRGGGRAGRRWASCEFWASGLLGVCLGTEVSEDIQMRKLREYGMNETDGGVVGVRNLGMGVGRTK